jgi:hypothetical protein
MRYINADPFAAQFLCGMDRGSATAERVEYYVVFVAGRAYDALQ